MCCTTGLLKHLVIMGPIQQVDIIEAGCGSLFGTRMKYEVLFVKLKVHGPDIVDNLGYTFGKMVIGLHLLYIGLFSTVLAMVAAAMQGAAHPIGGNLGLSVLHKDTTTARTKKCQIQRNTVSV